MNPAYFSTPDPREKIKDIMHPLGKYYILFIPLIGGLIGGPMIYFFAHEAKGHGVPEVMEAVAMHGGRIRPRVAVVKTISSAICIGTGGSAGQEGPIVQVGAVIGSTVGQLLRMSDARIRNLVACGAAAGISASIVSRYYFGNIPVFQIPQYSINNPIELVFCIIISLISAIADRMYYKHVCVFPFIEEFYLS